MATEKLDMQSPDGVETNVQKLAELFPNCVTETAEGKAVDFDLLKQELNHQIVEGNKERYRLEWPGKREAIVTANLPTTQTLRPVREDSEDFDNTENLYIEGDNLEVLKLLQESYLGKIKMIYIDPPYNTGKDFVYKDNFTEDKTEHEEESGQRDEYGQRLVANPETSGRYHSDWLTMMYPRLKLARNLLTDDGVIFISIDDNEVHNLRKICDEVFGEGNFISELIWERAYSPKNDAKYISKSHDFVLMYTKIIDEFIIGRLERTEAANARYTNPDNDPRGNWKPGDMSVKTYNESYDYPITTPSGKIVEPPTGRCWRFSKEAYEKALNDNRIWFGTNNDSVPQVKRFLTELKFEGMAPTSIMFYKDVGHSQEGAKEVTALLEAGAFDGPKPQRFISRLLTLANLKEDSVVLDFFSGSASTAHAVMQLNAEDDGNRKYIMVQLPEATDEKSEAYKAGYKNICEIGKERLRRAAKKIKEETNADIDYGFRVYRLDSSNMQDVYYRPQDYKQDQLDIFEDNVKPDRTANDLLAQVMLDWGLPLSLKIEQEKVQEKQVFKVAENFLFACFDNGVDEAFAKEIAAYKPLRIVFRDSSFKDNSAKENVRQLLKQLSPDTEMKVI
ncbi:MAG TPA: site-specific DNA-methyltransferase [Moheibacter sp.]|nr:site-specific DNA-methyltransferase [Moheibacter sp.]